MGFFSFFSLTKEIAIDLGTANTIIIHDDKIVIDEPSIVAIDKKTDRLVAVGLEAQEMQGKEHDGIKTVRPLSKGVIADFTAAEMMIRGLVKKASTKSNWFQPIFRNTWGASTTCASVNAQPSRSRCTSVQPLLNSIIRPRIILSTAPTR